MAQNPVPEIQRVPHLFENLKHYSHKLVSIGPIHYGEEKLKLGEKYKLRQQCTLHAPNKDVLLLENQLPYQVLKLLSCHENDAELIKSVNEFLQWYYFSRPKRRRRRTANSSSWPSHEPPRSAESNVCDILEHKGAESGRD